MLLNPKALWLLVIPISVAIYQLRGTSATSAGRNVITVGLRLLALGMLVLALAQPIHTVVKTGKTVVAVIDCSASMRLEDLRTASDGLRSLVDKTGRENVRLIVFGASAREVELEDDLLAPNGLAKLRFGDVGSNISAALELASSLGADDGNTELHLFSDGRETHGDMLRAAARIGRRPFKLVTHEIGAVAESSPLLLGAHASGSAAVGQSVPLTMRIEALNPVSVTVRVVDREGTVVGSRSVSLRAGIQEVAVFIRPNQPGRQTYRISLAGGDQTLEAGLKVVRTVVGVVESAPGAPAAGTLRALLGGNADIRSLKPGDLNGDVWDGLDVLVLADTPAAEIPEATQKALRNWVEQGGGLLVAGGRNAFGPGGYAHCQFADVLPLRFPQKKEVRDPSTALAILIDTSVSMKDSGVNLAKEIARLALKRLKPHDKAGIVEFYGTKRWAAPMQSAANHIGLQRALNRLSAGGGTQLLPGLTEAYYGLLNVNTRTKHILLLTDGGVERGAYSPLIDRMVEDGIQLSTVTVGPRASSTFLAQLARQGRGQFYTAPNRFKLPEVIVKQPSSSLLNPFVEKPVRLKGAPTSRLVKDLDFDEAPALQGYVRTTAKKTAEVLLRSESGDPVLARWNYGLGRVGAFATHIGGEWSGEFTRWSAMPQLMANIIRQLQGVSPQEKLAIVLRPGSPGLDVDMRALSSTPSMAMEPLRVDIVDASGKRVATRKLLPAEPNVWHTIFSGLPVGSYTVNVSNDAGDRLMGAGAVVIPPPNEFTRIAPDREKLAAADRIASEQAMRVDRVAPGEWGELWPACVLSALICFILMILVRRLPSFGAANRLSAARSVALVAAVALSTMAGDVLAGEPIELSPAEKRSIDEILQMEPDAARQNMKDACGRMIGRHGDLETVCEYLASGETTSTTAQLLAIVALEDGNVPLARKTLENRVNEDPADLWAMIQLARIHDMNGSTKDALRTLNLCLDSATDPAMRFALLVRRLQLLYSENQIDTARVDIRTILKQPGFDRPGVRNYCARIAGLWGDFVMVEELFVPTGEGRALMRDLLYFGQILLQRGNARRARDVFGEALAVARTSSDRRYVLDRLVTAAREAGTLAELIGEWQSDTNLQPEQLELMVGVLSGELNRVTDVLPILDRTDVPAGTRKVIESAEFQTRVLMELLAAGHSELVHRKYKALIAKNPGNYFLHEGYARLLLTEGRRGEAIDFLQQTIAAEQDAGGLMRLAKIARGLSLQDVAITTAEKAGGVDESVSLQAKLFIIEQYRLMDRTAEGLKILQELDAQMAGNPKVVGFLAEAYEKYGRPKDSIRLYRAAYDKTKDEEILKKLLTIADVNRQPDKGFALWRELWENASEPMTIVQAQDRMLALGAETGVLADLAIEFEEKLDDGQLSDRELTMLLEIYTSANDPVSAADILVELAEKNDADRVDTYRKMVRVYMECELFGRCTAILRQLIRYDPENRDDYLRSLALIALERQSRGDAAAVLGELADRSGNGVLNDSFSAGVLSMIGRPVEAAQAYRRALAANPNDAESWLLWANAEKAVGKAGRDRAIGRLSLLMEESDDNDLFTIGVDGLLNVGAPRPVLGAALRRVYGRIANQPHKRFLYQVAADLNDELGQQQQAARVLEQSLAITDEGREIILRELMAIARQRNSVDEVVRHSRSLLNTARGVPPDECLELGAVLLGKGHVSEADNAFLRIISEGDTRGIGRDIVQRYESAGYYRKAAKLIRELVLSNPHDMDLILRKALIEEKIGNDEVATSIYLDAFDHITGKLPSVKTSDGRNMGTPGADIFTAVVDGLVLSARATKSRKRLLEQIHSRFDTELRTLKKGDGFGKNIGDNPRLAKLHDAARRLAVIFHDRDCLESIDDAIARHYSADPHTVRRLASWLSSWGLQRLPNDLLQKYNQRIDFPANLYAHILDPAAFEAALSARPTSPYLTETSLSIAAKFGYDDVLGTMMRNADLASIPKLNGVTLAKVGVASGDAEFQRKVLFETLAPSRRRYRTPVGSMLMKQIPVVWYLLDEVERRSAVNQYALKSKTSNESVLYLECKAGNSSKIDIATLRKEVGESTGVNLSKLDPRISARRRRQLPEPYAWAALARWFRDKPEADRAGVLNQLVTGMEPGARACVLAQFAVLLDDEDINDALFGEFRKLFRGSDVSSSNSNERHMSRPVFLALSDYNRNRLTEHVRANMAENAQGEIAFDLLAGGVTGDQDRDLEQRLMIAVLIRKAQMKSDPRAVFHLHAFVLQPLASALSAGQLDKMLSRYRASDDPLDMLIQFLLLRHAGRDAEALDVLIQMRSLRTEDSRSALVREILPAILVSYGWDVYASQFMGSGSDPHLSGMLLPYRLHDPLALLAGAGPGLLDADARRMLVGTLLQDPAMIHEAGRLFLTDTRHPTSGRIRTMPPWIGMTLGGLRGMEARSSDYVLDALADSDTGAWEAYNWLSAHHQQGGKNLVGSVLERVAAEGIARHGVPGVLRDELNRAATKSMLNAVDISMVQTIAEHDPEQLPQSLTNEMATIVFRGGPKLAGYCETAGMEHYARSLTRWALAGDIVNKGTSRWLPQHLQLLPESERRERMRALLPLMGLNGIRQELGGDEAVLFETLLDLGMKTELSQLLDRYLLRLRQPSFNGNLQDSVAIALARIDRLDDYRNVLYRRAFLDQQKKLDQYCVAPTAFATDDYSRSLPEPDQVTDIGRCIDIHLAIHTRLREHGIINRETHVAQVCLLGKWCADRGLKTRAMELLNAAVELGEGLLTGRLWVADLHRQLGDEEAAVDIERELLRLELLPVARVPAVLKVVAADEGQDQADTIAYRASAYSNHPELLPMALRHAQNAGLKEEAADLSQRIEKLERLIVK